MGPARSQIDIGALLAKLNPPSTPIDAVSKLARLASQPKNRAFATSVAPIAGMATERAIQAHRVRLDWAIRVLATFRL